MEGVAVVQSCVSPKTFYRNIIKSCVITFFFKLALTYLKKSTCLDCYLDIISLLYKMFKGPHIYLNFKIKKLSFFYQTL